MDKAYYIEYYRLEREHWWFRARKKIIFDHIRSIASGNNLKILNIGAATGASSEMLSYFGEVTSLEYDKECCEFVKRRSGEEFICASITELPFADGTFDMVCAFDVIEHVKDDEKGVEEMYRVCRKDGMLVCTVPAFNFLWSHHDVVNHHERRYTISNLRKLFQRNGQLIFSSYFNTILFLPIAVFRLIDRIFKPKFVRHDAGSDFSVVKSSLLDSVFYAIMSIDNLFIRMRVRLPFGVSILLSAKK